MPSPTKTPSIPAEVARLFASREERGYTSHADAASVAAELLDLGLDAPERDDEGGEVDAKARPATPEDLSKLEPVGSCELGPVVKAMVLTCMKAYLDRLSKAEERVALLESSLSESEHSLREATNVATRATAAAETLLSTLNKYADKAEESQLKISGALAMVDKLLEKEVPSVGAIESATRPIIERIARLEQDMPTMVERIDRLVIGSRINPAPPPAGTREAPWKPTAAPPPPPPSSSPEMSELEVPDASVFMPQTGTWEAPRGPGPVEAELELPDWAPQAASLLDVGDLGGPTTPSEELEVPDWSIPAEAAYVPPPIETAELEVPDFGMFN